MNSENIKYRKGECGYCFKPSDLLYGVNFRYRNTYEIKTTYICNECKSYLRGLFRYDRITLKHYKPKEKPNGKQ